MFHDFVPSCLAVLFRVAGVLVRAQMFVAGRNHSPCRCHFPALQGSKRYVLRHVRTRARPAPEA